jgi:hypothetical protein
MIATGVPLRSSAEEGFGRQEGIKLVGIALQRYQL